jgi:hypothetical protein
MFQIHYFLENQVEPGIEHGSSGSVASNSDDYTTEAIKEKVKEKKGGERLWWSGEGRDGKGNEKKTEKIVTD